MGDLLLKIKKLLASLIALGFFLLPCERLSADTGLDSLYFDMRTSFHQEIHEGDYSSEFRGEYLNLHVRGHISDKLTYRIRQRFDKKVFVEDNPLNGTDMMYLDYRPSEHWSLLVGKYAVLIGGYEYDAAPIDVYYYSKFCNLLPQGFTFGVTGSYNFTASQSIVAQICNSPLSRGSSTTFAYNMAWKGQFASWWETLWSINYIGDNRSKYIGYLALGNHFIFGPTILDIDFMNRSAIGQDSPVLGDGTIIGKFIWSVGKWNICAKAGYEWNDESNRDSSGEAYDTVIAPGTKYTYAGCGLEWFPIGRDKLRLHAVYYWDSDEMRNNFELGVTWKANIYRKISKY